MFELPVECDTGSCAFYDVMRVLHRSWSKQNKCRIPLVPEADPSGEVERSDPLLPVLLHSLLSASPLDVEQKMECGIEVTCNFKLLGMVVV